MDQQVSVVMTANGRVLVGGESGECVEWSISGRRVKTVFSGRSPITSLFTVDGDYVLVGCADGSISFIDAKDHISQTINSMSTAAHSLTMNDHFLFSGHEDGRVRIWSMGNLHLKRVIPSGGVVTAMAVFKDLLVVGTAGGRLELYNWQTGELVKEFIGEHLQMITKIMIDEEGLLIVSGSLDGVVISRTITTNQETASLIRSQEAIDP
jgi:WD40 repeat protein